MDEIFDYYRIQNICDYFTTDYVTSITYLNKQFFLSTEAGSIVQISCDDCECKSFRVHSSRINCLTSITGASNCSTVASCYEDGSVVLNYFQDNTCRIVTKDYFFTSFIESTTAICLIESISIRERKLLVGLINGQLILYDDQLPKGLAVWNSKKTQVIFSGDASPVTQINRVDAYVVWADLQRVRILDLKSLSSICVLDGPSGVSIHQPLPVSLFWESNVHLWIGWGNSIRNIQISPISKDSKTISEWTFDSIVCGLSVFDTNNVLAMCYDGSCSDDDKIDMRIIERKTGSMILSDKLSLTQSSNLSGPWGHIFHSNYYSNESKQDFDKWSSSAQVCCNSSSLRRGDNRGFVPFCIITSGSDVVLAKVRDVNERIRIALSTRDLLRAANLAYSYKADLAYFKKSDIIHSYIEDLLFREKVQDHFQLAALECKRLIGSDDAQLWERCILSFGKMKAVKYLLAFIPMKDPLLSSSTYQMVIESLLINKESKELFILCIKWTRNVDNSLFDHHLLLQNMEKIQNSSSSYHSETKAYLQCLNRQYEKALNCFFEINVPRVNELLTDIDVTLDSRGVYSHVFDDLIESKNLYAMVKDKVTNLIRLNRDLTAQFLIRNLDKITVKDVADELRRTDRKLLHWWLNTLFLCVPEIYNTREYAGYHHEQVDLFVEFTDPPNTLKRHNLEIEPKGNIMASKDVFETDFIVFLRSSSHINMETALTKCKSKKLYYEVAFLLARMGKTKEALQVILSSIGDIEIAVNFIEKYDKTIWKDFLSYCIVCNDTFLLVQLLDYIGVLSINPSEVISKLQTKIKIPQLKARLINIFSHMAFQEIIADISNSGLAHDTVSLLKSRNQGQRRAVRVDIASRCTICAQLLLVPTNDGVVINKNRTGCHVVCSVSKESKV